ncbi:MAG: hypothetical protein LKM37_09065 [Bacteroidales bacterium]|nr:hypothetical protein [Bacteroidales bacterium]MCI1733512.1 hypothetical protein [Bacteroidales bacterium]
MKKRESKKTLCAPSYLNDIINYAVNNCNKNADDGTNSVAKIEFKITVAEDSPLFEEKIVFTDGSEKLLDCWEIFDLAKTIMDDKERTWKEMTVIIEDNKQLTINLL